MRLDNSSSHGGSVTRERVVEIAQTWLGTPFHDGQGVKGAGVDCAYFPWRVGGEVGLFPKSDLPPYSIQAMCHSAEENYVAALLEYGGHEISESQVGPGDLVLFKLRGSMSHSHGAIVIRWPEFILHPIRDHGVIGSHALETGFLRRRSKRFFSFF